MTWHWQWDCCDDTVVWFVCLSHENQERSANTQQSSVWQDPITTCHQSFPYPGDLSLHTSLHTLNTLMRLVDDYNWQLPITPSSLTSHNGAVITTVVPAAECGQKNCSLAHQTQAHTGLSPSSTRAVALQRLNNFKYLGLGQQPLGFNGRITSIKKAWVEIVELWTQSSINFVVAFTQA